MKKIQAYESSTGAIFSTREEANMDEIREAADLVSGVDKDYLIRIVAGQLTNIDVQQAILRLAEAIDPRPVCEDRAA